MPNHILLAAADFRASHRATDIAIALAATLGARLHVLHVRTPRPAVELAADAILGGPHARRTARRTRANLAEITGKARSAGVPCQVEQVFDHRPYAAIAGVAMQHRCDLIVMGAHARGAPLATDITHQVILNCDLPVLVCP